MQVFITTTNLPDPPNLSGKKNKFVSFEKSQPVLSRVYAEGTRSKAFSNKKHITKGYKVIRFTNEQILFDIDNVIRIVRQNLSLKGDKRGSIGWRIRVTKFLDLRMKKY